MTTKARKIVDTLLEDGESFDPEELVGDAGARQQALQASGVITLNSALNARGFYSRTHKYKSRNEPVYARRNGRTKTWKRQPGRFSIPVKIGLYEYGHINNDNAHEWSTVPNPTSGVDKSFYGDAFTDAPPDPSFFDA